MSLFWCSSLSTSPLLRGPLCLPLEHVRNETRSLQKHLLARVLEPKLESVHEASNLSNLTLHNTTSRPSNPLRNHPLPRHSTHDSNQEDPSLQNSSVTFLSRGFDTVLYLPDDLSLMQVDNPQRGQAPGTFGNSTARDTSLIYSFFLSRSHGATKHSANHRMTAFAFHRRDDFDFHQSFWMCLISL